MEEWRRGGGEEGKRGRVGEGESGDGKNIPSSFFLTSVTESVAEHPSSFSLTSVTSVTESVAELPS
ncbi:MULTISPECIES: hypothetical protein [unclassified Microcoleus]|uniref:hypothetical protein n=1 Tax=unclassified Microcoleus TaxID=2642155 RepID=UPI002FD2A55A